MAAAVPDKYRAKPRPRDDKRWLEYYYHEKGYSTIQMARMIGTHSSAIRQKLVEHGIEPRPSPSDEPDHWERRGSRERMEYVGPPEEPDDEEIDPDWTAFHNDRR